MKKSVVKIRARNEMPEGVNFSTLSKKWIARVNDGKGNVTSIGQHSDKAIADQLYTDYYIQNPAHVS